MSEADDAEKRLRAAALALARKDERIEELERENAALKRTLQGYREAWAASNEYVAAMTQALEAAGIAALSPPSGEATGRQDTKGGDDGQ